MGPLNVLLGNLIAIPNLSFLVGILFSFFNLERLFHRSAHTLLTYLMLFFIGLKGGGALMEHSSSQFFLILAVMIFWGLAQPILSYGILRKFTNIDTSTAAAIAACFGSVSVMTFAAAAAFLEQLQVSYQGLVIAILAIMEVPAIISGLFIFQSNSGIDMDKAKNFWIHVFFNKTILMILLGLILGVIFHYLKLNTVVKSALFVFKPCLCFFLFNMGLLIGARKQELNQFSWSLGLFGVYMPLIGAVVGIILSYCLGLDAGTGTLIAVLSASASYIAVPAVAKVAMPRAKESIYLPLSLAVAFPFNVLIGIPAYYFLAVKVLS